MPPVEAAAEALASTPAAVATDEAAKTTLKSRAKADPTPWVKTAPASPVAKENATEVEKRQYSEEQMAAGRALFEDKRSKRNKKK